MLLSEVVEWFRPVPTGLLVDATLGGAGHATALLNDRPDQHLLGFDQDPLAIGVATQRLASFGDRARVAAARFDEMAATVAASGVGLPIVGVLFDLGVSSAQFDLGERGFSYRHDAPLDMRMNTSAGRSAAEMLADISVAELRAILRDYADERFADRIARAVVAARPTTTGELATVVTEAIPAPARRTGGHPAKRTFQAIRVAVNDELAVFERALDQALDLLAPQGRVVVLSYQSGENRIAKDRFRTAETGGCTCPPGLPCVCGSLPRGRSVRRGVIRPTEAEVAANPRASSAVARVFERSGPVSRPGPEAPASREDQS